MYNGPSILQTVTYSYVCTNIDHELDEICASQRAHLTASVQSYSHTVSPTSTRNVGERTLSMYAAHAIRPPSSAVLT